MTKPAGSRRLMTRAELAAAHGISKPTLDRLWAKRADNGHPDYADKDGRTLLWDADEWASWYASTQARPGPGEEPDPDEEIGPAEFARILGHKHPKWVAEAARSTTPPEQFPAPDRWEDGARGRRPLWKRRRAQKYADTPGLRVARAGAGHPGGALTRRHQYAGDFRLALARGVLARHPDEPNTKLINRLEELSETQASRSTWTKILATTPRNPLPISAAMSARMSGKARPPGQAR
jgi:hypothetical protein